MVVVFCGGRGGDADLAAQLPLQALDLALPTWEARGVRPKIHLSSQDPSKRPGGHSYSIEPEDWEAVVEALDGRETDVMVEAKGKELAALGYRVVIVPSDLQRAAIHAMRRAAREMRERGNTSAISNQLTTFDDREALIREPLWDERERRFGADN